MRIVEVRPIGLLARLGDVLMAPVMYLVAGTLREKPQRTHIWNIQTVSQDGTERLDEQMMVHCNGIPQEVGRWVFLHHIPILGGWKNYTVLQPCSHDGVWHVGWRTADRCEISILSLKGPVRMLIGPGDVSFLGLSPDGDQIPVQEIGRGRIGDRGPHSKTQLC